MDLQLPLDPESLASLEDQVVQYCPLLLADLRFQEYQDFLVIRENLVAL